MKRVIFKRVVLFSSILMTTIAIPILADEVAEPNQTQDKTVMVEKQASPETVTTSSEVSATNESEEIQPTLDEPAATTANSSQTSAQTVPNEGENAEVSTIPEVTVEEYHQNTADLKKVSINDVYQMFTPDGKDHVLYVGRPTCYYCRQFSPEVKKLNMIIPTGLEYYDTDSTDFDEAAQTFLYKTVGIPGTPTLLRLTNASLVSAWVGGGSADEVYRHLFKKELSERATSSVNEKSDNRESQEVQLTNVNKEDTSPIQSVLKTAASQSPIKSNSEKVVDSAALVTSKEKIVVETSNKQLPNTASKASNVSILGFASLAMASLLAWCKKVKN